jgi:hypothetical protein
MAKDGLILVLDMDQTIIDSTPFFRKDPLDSSMIPEFLNMNLVNILLRAAKLRPKKVKGIFLLTNNSDKEFVANVDSAILDLSKGLRGKYNTSESGDPDAKNMPQKPYFFDDIFTIQHSMRKTHALGVRAGIKDLHTILEMIHTIDPKYHSNLMKNLFFFDDVPTHKLHEEFINSSGGKYKSHYITITPPYNKGIEDKTDYKPILRAMSMVDRKTRRKQRYHS